MAAPGLPDHLARSGGEGAYLVGRHPDTSWQMAQDQWENRDRALAALETGGIGAASALTVGGVTYGLLTRKRRELMSEWVFPLHEALTLPLRLPEQTDPRRYLHIPKNSPTTPRRYASTCRGAWTSPRT